REVAHEGDRGVEGRRSGDPEHLILDVGDGARVAVALYEAQAEHLLGVVERAPGDAAGEALLEGGGPWRVVAAQAGGHDADARGIDVVAASEEVDAGARRALRLDLGGQAMQAERAAAAGLVAGEAGDAVVRVLLRQREVVEFLQPVEAVEVDDARR